MQYRTDNREKGTVLLVSLLLLLILSIIGIAGMSTSIFGLRMAGNIQSMYDSFQVADAGRAAAMSDPANFNGGDQDDIFSGDDYIVAKVNVVRLLPDQELECPRSPTASSVSFIGCEYYELDSEHLSERDDVVSSGAQTRIFGGATKEILAR